jgi:hypothetical protein
MAVTPLTLADYAESPKLLVAGVAKVMRETSPFWDALPMPQVSALSVKVYREAGALTDVSWRQIGEAHGSVVHAMPDEVQEMAYSIGNTIKVDKVHVMDKTPRLVDPMTYQSKQTVKAIARNFTDKAINGVPLDLKNPVGLYYRIMNDLPTTQRIGCGSGLDISQDATALTANIQILIDKLDELLYSVTDSIDAGGQGVLLLTNDTVMQRVNSAFRQSGLLTTSKDALGRVFLEYRGARFIDMGRKYDDTTRVMGNVEVLTGTGLTTGTGSSIYAVKLGNEYFTGWQEYGLDVSKPELDPTTRVTYYSVIDWVVGLALSHPRSAARLYGLIAA